jgi:hypothetical protein
MKINEIYGTLYVRAMDNIEVYFTGSLSPGYPNTKLSLIFMHRNVDYIRILIVK